MRVLGRFERYRVAAFLDVDLPDPHRGRPAGNWWRRFVTRLRSGALWRELAHHLVLLPQGILFFCVVVAAWSVALTALTLPATIWAIPDQQVYVWSGVALHGWVAGVLGALTGLVLLPLVPFVVRGLVEAEVALARLLLGPSRSEALEGRVSQLTETRSRVVDAAEAERRRIERDLHDGAQQRLVALAMDLGRAQEKFDTDPEGARALVDDAHREAKQALVELRDLARGIHPAVLTDRGLDAALSRGGRPLTGAGPAAASTSASAPTRPSRASPTSWCARRWPTWPSTPAPAGPSVTVARRGTAAARRGHRRRPRRRRRDDRQRPRRPARPGRGRRRLAARVEPARRPDHSPGGAPVRIVIAEDAVLLRAGLTRLLDRRRRGGRRRRRRSPWPCSTPSPASSPTSASSTCGCRRRSPTRASGRRCASAPSSPGPRCSCSASTSSRSTRPSCSPANTDSVGYLLKDRVADVRRLRRRRAPGRRAAAPPSTPRWSPSCSPAPVARTRSTASPTASARCSGSWPKVARTGAIGGEPGRQRRRRREARLATSSRSSTCRRRRRPPAGARRAALPGVLT